MKKRIVIALGGNALGENLKEQMAAARITAGAIVDLVEEGHELVIVHGNGPQVGMIETAFETAAKADKHFPVLPMSVCVALSQGYIGYDLQNTIRFELDKRKMKQQVAQLLPRSRLIRLTRPLKTLRNPSAILCHSRTRKRFALKVFPLWKTRAAAGGRWLLHRNQ